MTKRGLHTIRHRPQFSQTCCRNIKYDKKSSLNSSKNRLLQRTHFAKMFFVKHSRIWRITLYTLFAVRMDFVRSFLFRHCLQIVCSWLKTTPYTLHRDLAVMSQTKWRGQSSLQLLLHSEILLFWRTSCARDFFFMLGDQFWNLMATLCIIQTNKQTN